MLYGEPQSVPQSEKAKKKCSPIKADVITFSSSNQYSAIGLVYPVIGNRDETVDDAVIINDPIFFGTLISVRKITVRPCKI